ncbi:GNAT family N-acetyltransferase [Sedimentibacter sp. B4]|uniref:GNAT family N-acetyltransferase n=1 Tax=Sedimentibacter sp. B4 TaxID=304766 RepID=UPI0002D41081|nr:GNAT family N-acetyltransferase [Sedimentibacter sp. B4]
MIRKLDLKNPETAKCILELQIASYSIEADIIRFNDIPPLKDTVENINKCDEIFYGYYINDVLAGIISYKIKEKVIDIHRVAIHPLFFRMGIANNLINFIEELENSINKVAVSTGKENLPAVNLYLRNGYKRKNDIEIFKGMYITEFEKDLKLPDS